MALLFIYLFKYTTAYRFNLDIKKKNSLKKGINCRVNNYKNPLAQLIELSWDVKALYTCTL